MIRILLRDLVEAGVGIALGGGQTLQWGCPTVPSAALRARLTAHKPALLRVLRDGHLALAWPTLPTEGLTSTLRVLLAWYAAERRALAPGARAGYERRVALLVQNGWPRWHAGIVSIEALLLAGADA